MANPFSDNPYGAPSGHSQFAPPPIPPNTIQVAPCYRCRCPYATKVTATLWGGLIGPRLLNHVRCIHCSATFNGKTGKSNDTAIVIYVVVLFVIFLVVSAYCIIMSPYVQEIKGQR